MYLQDGWLVLICKCQLSLPCVSDEHARLRHRGLFHPRNLCPGAFMQLPGHCIQPSLPDFSLSARAPARVYLRACMLAYA